MLAHGKALASSDDGAAGAKGRVEEDGLPWALVRAILLAAGAMCMAGYDQGMIDAAMLTMRSELQLRQQM